jgi:type IV pilus assembly protein PilV
MILHKQTGFSLLEVMIAMVVLAIGVLGLAPLVTVAIYGNTYSNDLTVANSLAEEEMERLVNMNTYGSLPFITVTDSVGGTFKVVRTVEDNSSNGGVPIGVYRLNVALSWTDHKSIQRFANLTTYKPKS